MLLKLISSTGHKIITRDRNRSPFSTISSPTETYSLVRKTQDDCELIIQTAADFAKKDATDDIYALSDIDILNKEAHGIEPKKGTDAFYYDQLILKGGFSKYMLALESMDFIMNACRKFPKEAGKKTGLAYVKNRDKLIRENLFLRGFLTGEAFDYIDAREKVREEDKLSLLKIIKRSIQRIEPLVSEASALRVNPDLFAHAINTTIDETHISVEFAIRGNPKTAVKFLPKLDSFIARKTLEAHSHISKAKGKSPEFPLDRDDEDYKAYHKALRHFTHVYVRQK